MRIMDDIYILHFFVFSIQIRNKIFVDGCLTLLTDRLDNDVVPMLVIYAVIGVCLALLEVSS